MSDDKRDKGRNGVDSGPLVLEEEEGLFGQYDEKEAARGSGRKEPEAARSPGPKEPEAEQPLLALEDIDETEIDELLNIEATDGTEPAPIPERVSSSRLVDLAEILEKGAAAEIPGAMEPQKPLARPATAPPGKPKAGPVKPIPGLFSKAPQDAPPAREPAEEGSEAGALLSELLGTEDAAGAEEALAAEEELLFEEERGDEPTGRFEHEVAEVTDEEITEIDEGQAEEILEAELLEEGVAEAPLAEAAPADEAGEPPGAGPGTAPEQTVAPPGERAEPAPRAARVSASGPPEPVEEPEYREVSRPSEIPISGQGLLTMALSRKSFAVDAGAEIAKRTIRRRAAPGEHAQLVGSGEEVDRARMALLEHLAEGSSGSIRSRLLVAAAEMGEALGEEDRAYELYSAASQADPSDAVAAREARKRAMARGEWQSAAGLLEGEARLALGPAERALVLTALAELRLRRLGDSAGARQAAADALQGHPRCLAAALLLREIELGEGRPVQAVEALARVSGSWQDAQARAALLMEAGRILEQHGRAAEAQVHFRSGADADPESIGARLGLLRSARAAGDIESAIKALVEIRGLAEPGPIRDEVGRTAARYTHFLAGRPEQAYELLQEDHSVPGLRARARAAEASGDRDMLLSALQSWVDRSEGSERALALFELGRARFAGGQVQEADQALAEACMVDSSLGIAAVMREMIARQSGDAAGLARAMEGGAESSALRTAAKLLRSGDPEQQERELLARACLQTDSPLTAEVIKVDIAARAGDLQEVRESLLRAADRSHTGAAVGPLLAWMDLARAETSAGDGRQDEQPGPDDQVVQQKSAEVLHKARAGAGASAGALRRIARYTGESLAAAEIWLEEADSAQGEHAAFAARQAGRLLEEGGKDPIEAYRKALETVPGYGPACWALDHVALASGDRGSSILAHEQLAAHAVDARERTKRLILAALMEMGDDDQKAVSLLGQASALFPADSVLKQLMLRITDESQADRFAEMLLKSAEGLPPAWSIAARLRAASAYEDGGQPDKAAELYQAVLEEESQRQAAETLTSPPVGIDTSDTSTPTPVGSDILDDTSASTPEETGSATTEGEAGEEAAEVMASAPPEAKPSTSFEAFDGEEPGDEAGEGSTEPGSAEPTVESADTVAETSGSTESVEGGEGAGGVEPPTPVESAESSTPFAGPGLDRAQIAAGQIEQVVARFAREAEQSGGEQARAALLGKARLELEHAQSGEALERAAAALLDLDPGYLAASRALERHYMKQGNEEALQGVAESTLRSLTDPADVAGYLRWAAGLTELFADPPLEKSDELVLREAGRAEPDLWIGHRLEAAARRSSDTDRIVEAVAGTVPLYASAIERASVALRQAEMLESLSSLQAAESLEAAVREAPEHPAAAEELGRLYEAAGEHARAAQAFENAARAERIAERRARLWHRAGVLWQDEVKDEQRATAALQNIGSQDAVFKDTFARLRMLMGEKGETGHLVELIEQRLQAGGDKAEQIRLHVELSRLQSESGEREAAKRSLSTAAGLDPQNLEVLRGLAEFYLQDQQWEQAVQPLIAMARLARENEPMIWAFLRLGEIYHDRLPDPKRAEAAFIRVVGMDAGHVEAIERLVDIFRRQGQQEKAVRALQRLLQLTEDAESKRGYLLQMAVVYEELGKHREAEQMMQACRQEAPTDLRVVRALAGFYRRQAATPALNVHLNLTCNEFRNAVSGDPSNPESWKGLVEVLNERGHRRAARCCVATARAMGVSDAELGALLDDASATALCKNALRNKAIDKVIAPPLLTETTRLVIQGAAPALESILPLELERYGAKKLRARPEITDSALAMVCEWFGLKQVSTYSVSARLWLPVSGDPLTILIGEPLLEECGQAEQLFLFARSAKIAQEGLCPVVRARFQDLGFAVNALIRQFDASFEPKGVSLEKLDEMARRIGKLIPRRVHEALGPSVYEMGGSPGFDPALLPGAALELGARSALVATGDSPAALSALLALGGSGARIGRADETIRAVRGQQEASALFAFALSDIFFEACEKALDLEKG